MSLIALPEPTSFKLTFWLGSPSTILLDLAHTNLPSEREITHAEAWIGVYVGGGGADKEPDAVVVYIQRQLKNKQTNKQKIALS